MILGQATPAFTDLAWIALFGTLTFFLGGLFFRYLKRGFADVL
jgi:ABC-type polysaccharide/polyol phosphate export permease